MLKPVDNTYSCALIYDWKLGQKQNCRVEIVFPHPLYCLLHRQFENKAILRGLSTTNTFFIYYYLDYSEIFQKFVLNWDKLFCLCISFLNRFLIMNRKRVQKGHIIKVTSNSFQLRENFMSPVCLEHWGLHCAANIIFLLSFN